jgi:hypothetical protein
MRNLDRNRRPLEVYSGMLAVPMLIFCDQMITGVAQAGLVRTAPQRLHSKQHTSCRSSG